MYTVIFAMKYIAKFNVTLYANNLCTVGDLPHTDLRLSADGVKLKQFNVTHVSVYSSISNTQTHTTVATFRNVW